MVNKIQHATAGFPLLLVAMGKLADEGERFIAIAEMAIALAVIVTFAKDLRDAFKKHAPHSKVGWFDLAAGVLLIYEAFHGAHHKPGYMRPQFLAGVVTLAIGIFHARLHAFRNRRRYVKVDETGMELVRPFFRKLSLPWADIHSVDVAGKKAIIRRHDGRHHSFRLNLLHNHDEVRKHLADHARAAGVTTETVS